MHKMNRPALLFSSLLSLLALIAAPPAFGGKSPTISSLSPMSGAVGTSVTITGSNFGASQGSSTLTFNGVAATATSWKTGSITVPVPTNATTGPVIVTVNGVASNSVSFTVTPVISSLSSTSGRTGASITISGSGFGATQGSNSVSFNGTAATVTNWSAGSISAPVPSSATSGPVTVSVNGIASNGVAFTVVTLVSVAVSPQNASLAVGLGQQFTATATYSDQSTQDVTTAASWSSLSPAVATVGVWGAATAKAAGNTMITATYGNANGSSAVTVNAAELVNISITPTNGYLPQGNSEQLTATGTYSDGSTQDVTAAVTWGSSDASIVSVSASGLATAANTQGTAAITASENGLTFATGVTVTAQGLPSITASATPPPNAAGWNNSNVTVTFTCTPGTYPVTSCPAPIVVSTEGTGQIISGTVTDSGGQQATASVTLNIDETPPALTVTGPTDGAVLTSTPVAATGSVSDALSGVTSLACNQTSVSPSNGGFSCNISLNPGLNLVVVQATDAAGNIALTKMHVTLNVPFPPPASLSISPTNVVVGVGQTQQFSAVDDQGRMRGDATWTVSNSSIATITTDSSPVLTGVAVGQVTLTAIVQGVQTSEQVTVSGSALSAGAIEWSTLQDSYTVQGITPAVPSQDGPGFYDVEYSGTSSEVRAFTADGQQMWQQSVGQGRATVAADGFGGLLVQTAQGSIGTLMDLDAQTGSVVWQQPFASNIGPNAAFSMRPNGDFVVSGDNGVGPTGGSNVWMFSGSTGQPHPLLPFYLGQEVGNCFAPDSLGNAGANSITTDSSGNTYVSYGFSNYTITDDNCSAATIETDTQDTFARLITVDPNRGTTDQLVKQDEASKVCVVGGPDAGETLQLAGMISQSGIANPDGQGGVLVTWSHYPVSMSNSSCFGHNTPPSPPTEVSDISPGGSSQYELPLSGGGGNGQLVLGESGTAFMGTGAQVLAFNTSTGQINWSYSGGGDILAATDDGGVALMGGSPLNITEVDSTGTPQLIANYPTASCAPTISWQGAWLNCENQSPTAIALPLPPDSGSLWATPGGSPSANNDSMAGCGCLVETDSSNETNCPLCSLQSPNCQTLLGSGPTYLILIGDQGLDGHNVGELFALAAQTELNALQNQGDHVIACRASTVENVESDLTTNGLIDGGVIYFGHAGYLRYPGKTGYYSSLFVGEQPLTDNNIYADDLNQLSNTELGSNVTIVINACHAGSETPDGNPPIAALLGSQLKRTVQAYNVGMHFSNLQGNNDPTKNGGKNPSGLPMYMNPDGVPPRVQPIFFYSH